MKVIHALALLAAMTSGCGPRQPSTAAGTTAAIPMFAAGDPVVDTAGFVARTLRLHVDRFDTRYTLMAFAVGDQLTLGAMVKGPFHGRVRWLVGDRRLQLPFDSMAPGKQTPVEVRGAELALTAQGAAFDGTAWTNVELPRSWVDDGTPLQLQFVPDSGEPVALPDAEHHYVVQLTAK